ncbi:type III-A CRISPR-associated protein Cas10/Csm1 [Candidatus Bipolaricaulota sp. J31]
MREEVLKAALAGLLHDVGKLGMLTGETARGKYAHASVGERFVRSYVPAHWQDALAPVGWHHGEREAGSLIRPVEETELPVRLVALADRLSSGEREPHPEDTPRTKQLINIFGQLEGQGLCTTFFPPHKLAMEKDALFPRPEPLPKSEADHALAKLWDEFQNEAGALKGAYEPDDADIGCYLESMFWLLRDHTWCVPSAYWHSNPDVSLFSHLHMTAALAACLAHSHFVNGSLSEEGISDLLEGIKKEPWPEEPEIAGLLGGDISGIQSFIYSLHDPEGAARSLRARSFYLQILTEVIARWILRKLGLPITNALYIGGGSFTLIVPPSARGKLDELRREINGTLYKAHGISLYLGLGYVGLVPEDFRLRSGDTSNKKHGISKRREELGKILDRDKAKRFSSLPNDRLVELFYPRGFGGEASETEAKTLPCEVCGNEVPRDKIEPIDDVRFCIRCKAFHELGRDLIGARYLFMAQVEPRELKEDGPFTWDEILASFGAKIALLRTPEEIPPERPAILFALEDGLELLSGPKLAVGRKFLVNLVPTVANDEEHKELRFLCEKDGRVPGPGELKHFGILAKQSRGAPYLGILRMDMDNLGRIFSRGLGRYATLSRIATLSFLLSVFFEGWTEKIAEEVNKGHAKGWARLYTVYSGGDDLFFVGSWDAVVELARGIRRDLREFTGRDDLGISGGIVLVHEKYPLYVAADDADKAEKAAKAVKRRDDREKDAIAFLGTALPWEEFGYADGAGTASHWARRLARLIEENRIPRAVLERLQRFHAWYEVERDKRGENGPWLWHAAYWLSRMLERLKESDDEAREAIRELRDLLSQGTFAGNIARLALAARWAEHLTRKGG